MATISGAEYIYGGIFDFTEGGYSAPTWSGSTYTFGAGLAGEVNQIWTDSDYVYVATNAELSITDIESELVYAYISGNFNTIWANDDRIFLGTASGIKYLYKTCISGSTYTPYNLADCMYDYTPPYGTTSDSIRYIHGNDDFIMWCTDLGVDVYRLEPNGYRSYTTVSNAYKCFMTSDKFYYTISGSEWTLSRVNSTLVNWAIPDYSYTTGSGIFGAGLSINDIFITEDTSQNNHDNVIFAATSSGVYVIDEETLNKNVYYTEGTTNNFTAIWADPDAGLNSGSFYAATYGAFMVVKDGALSYRNTDDLDSDDIVDINVGGQATDG